MGLRINTNIASMTAQRYLQQVSGELGKTMARLSSGLRITSASDDPAGLGISERMRSQIRSMTVAQRNVQDGISLLQTAEGALAEVSNLFGKMRELVVASLNGTYSDEDRAVMDTEYQALLEEVTRIAETTEFNGQNLFDSNDTLGIVVGPDGQSVGIDLVDLTGFPAALQAFALDAPLGPDVAIAQIDSIAQIYSDARGSFGALQNRFESISRSLENQRENLSAAESRIRDADIAFESAQLVKQQIQQQVAVSVLAQANSAPSLVLQLLGA